MGGREGGRVGGRQPQTDRQADRQSRRLREAAANLYVLTMLFAIPTYCIHALGRHESQLDFADIQNLHLEEDERCGEGDR